MSSFKGQFVWYDLMTTDTKAAGDFYKAVVGWGTKDSGTPGMDYTLFTTVQSAPFGGVAGMMKAPMEGMHPCWMGYVAVDDVDASAAEVAAGGGTVHRPPTDIPGVGRFAVVADPQGAVINLFTGVGEPPQAPPPDTPGYVGWRELMAGEWKAAFDFYAKLFGWTRHDDFDMGPMGVYRLFAADGAMTGGMMTKPAEAPTPFWQYYFNVEAINAAADRVRAAGGQVLMGPHKVPSDQWIVVCMDPQGALFGLLSPKE